MKIHYQLNESADVTQNKLTYATKSPKRQNPPKRRIKDLQNDLVEFSALVAK